MRRLTYTAARIGCEAAGAFGELLIAYPDDGPTQILLQRSVEFIEEAPEPGWDGVYVMKSK